jgi:hypothetical protein
MPAPSTPPLLPVEPPPTPRPIRISLTAGRPIKREAAERDGLPPPPESRGFEGLREEFFRRTGGGFKLAEVGDKCAGGEGVLEAACTQLSVAEGGSVGTGDFRRSMEAHFGQGVSVSAALRALSSSCNALVVVWTMGEGVGFQRRVFGNAEESECTGGGVVLTA